MSATFDYSAARPSKGPKVLFTLGGIGLGVGILMVVIGAVLLGTGLFDTFKDLASVRENLETEVAVPGTGEVYLKADTYDVVAIGHDLVRRGRRGDDGRTTTGRTTRADFREPTVTVTSSEGTPLTLREPRIGSTVSVNRYDMVSLKTFTVTTPGTYLIEATGEPGPVTAVGVGQTGTLDGATVGKLVGGGVLFGLGFVFIVPGAVALIAAAIWRASDRNNRQPPLSGWQPPTSPPSGPPNAYPPSSAGGIPPFNAPGPPGAPPGRPPAPPPPWEPPQSPIS